VVCAALSLIVFSLSAARAQSLAPTAAPPPTIFAVGDIMHCDAPDGAEQTGRLMERLLDETPNSIGVTLGDNSNDDGSETSYSCIDRSWWGRLFGRLRPTPGNHDYGVDKDLPFYYLYFPHSGPIRQGYYAFDAGGWRVYALNTELDTPAARQAQLTWLEADLRASYASKCVLAYFHRPPFSSGRFASPAWAMPIFRKLYKYGADLALAGHEHFFATLPPLDPDGVVDRPRGIPTLIAGTGGAVFFPKPKLMRWASEGEDVIHNTLGVVSVTLKPGAFEWAFVGVNPMGRRLRTGAGTCHDNPPGFRD
jgi:hypothetical protein